MLITRKTTRKPPHGFGNLSSRGTSPQGKLMKEALKTLPLETCVDLLSATSSRASGSGPMLFDWQVGQTRDLFGPDPVRANLSARQAKDQGLMMSGTYGWFHLIEVCRPGVVLGEQVASKDGLGWLDLVYDDMEGVDYAVAALDIPASVVGAPHIRQRLYFVAEQGEASAMRLRGYGNVIVAPAAQVFIEAYIADNGYL